jgi:uncharacterized MAPEG superfamily protein
MNSTSIAALAAAALALWIKGMITSWAQVTIRVRGRALVRPEDARLLKVAPVDAEDPRVLRLAEVWRNELETSPAIMAMAAAYVLAGGGAAAFPWVLAAYVASRFGQGWSQYRQLQPARTLAWLASVASAAFVAILLSARLVAFAA